MMLELFKLMVTLLAAGFLATVAVVALYRAIHPDSRKIPLRLSFLFAGTIGMGLMIAAGTIILAGTMFKDSPAEYILKGVAASMSLVIPTSLYLLDRKYKQ